MMSNDKGKEKAVSNNSSRLPETTKHFDSQPIQQPVAPTFIEKVANSTRELSKHAFYAPHHEINDAFTTVTSSASKSQHTSSVGLPDRGESSTATATRETRSSDGETPTLKPSVPKEHVENLEKEFSSFLDGTDTLSPPENSDTIPETRTFHASWIESQGHLVQLPPRTIGEQEARDGEDVMSLLAFSPTTYKNSHALFEENGTNLELELSDVELTQLRMVAQDLSSIANPNNEFTLDNPHNLQMPPDSVTQTYMMGHSTSSAQQNWLQQWEGVLTKYTDEVWGSLLPLVKEARKEVENPSEMSNGSSRALVRLQAILRHVQK
jgi:hypothetical protein